MPLPSVESGQVAAAIIQEMLSLDRTMQSYELR